MADYLRLRLRHQLHPSEGEQRHRLEVLDGERVLGCLGGWTSADIDTLANFQGLSKFTLQFLVEAAEVSTK